MGRMTPPGATVAVRYGMAEVSGTAGVERLQAPLSKHVIDERNSMPDPRFDPEPKVLKVVRLPADPDKPHDLRAFVAVKGAETHRADYVPTGEAMTDKITRSHVLRDREREWSTFKRRYGHLAEFADIIDAHMEP